MRFLFSILIPWLALWTFAVPVDDEEAPLNATKPQSLEAEPQSDPSFVAEMAQPSYLKEVMGQVDESMAKFAGQYAAKRASLADDARLVLDYNLAMMRILAASMKVITTESTHKYLDLDYFSFCEDELGYLLVFAVDNPAVVNRTIHSFNEHLAIWEFLFTGNSSTTTVFEPSLLSSLGSLAAREDLSNDEKTRSLMKEIIKNSGPILKKLKQQSAQMTIISRDADFQALLSLAERKFNIFFMKEGVSKITYPDWMTPDVYFTTLVASHFASRMDMALDVSEVSGLLASDKFLVQMTNRLQDLSRRIVLFENIVADESLMLSGIHRTIDSTMALISRICAEVNVTVEDKEALALWHGSALAASMTIRGNRLSYDVFAAVATFAQVYIGFDFRARVPHWLAESHNPVVGFHEDPAETVTAAALKYKELVKNIEKSVEKFMNDHKEAIETVFIKSNFGPRISLETIRKVFSLKAYFQFWVVKSSIQTALKAKKERSALLVKKDLRDTIAWWITPLYIMLREDKSPETRALLIFTELRSQLLTIRASAMLDRHDKNLDQAIKSFTTILGVRKLVIAKLIHAIDGVYEHGTKGLFKRLGDLKDASLDYKLLEGFGSFNDEINNFEYSSLLPLQLRDHFQSTDANPLFSRAAMDVASMYIKMGAKYFKSMAVILKETKLVMSRQLLPAQIAEFRNLTNPPNGPLIIQAAQKVLKDNSIRSFEEFVDVFVDAKDRMVGFVSGFFRFARTVEQEEMIQELTMELQRFGKGTDPVDISRASLLAQQLLDLSTAYAQLIPVLDALFSA